MEIQFKGEIVHPVPPDVVLLSTTAVETLRKMFSELTEDFGKQEWEETYWLKSNGELIYKIQGEIPEAIQFCRIEASHWNITGQVH